MAVKRPTLAQLDEIALSLGIHLCESQLTSYDAMMQSQDVKAALDVRDDKTEKKKP